ncbi:MAG TPA: hypothetical protein DCY13_23730, partial [Verrucomicrobiales bacterium]|nr:hypothetical protein [Verrucomicrobiales bacterium]
MEIKYQLGTADFFAWYEHLQAKQKGRSREDYYRQTLWYLGVLALAIYVSAKHEEHFVVSILLALVLFYLWQNWSFEKSWRMAAEQYSNLVPASTGTLSIDGHGLTSTGDGVTTRLNWDAVEAVETTSDHVFVR